MPLFFMVAGEGSWFALWRRSASQFARERSLRLLVPFLTGTIVLGPVQLYPSWRHQSQTGVSDGSWLEFVADRLPRFGPKLFGAIGYHMRFLGFLFSFSLLTLPLFIWLKGEKGRSLVSRLASLSEHRGAILLLILPLAVARLGLLPFFPQMQDWADFFSHGTFFVLGYFVFADKRFFKAIRRYWWILIAVGVSATPVSVVIGMSLQSVNLEKPPHTFWELLVWGLVAACGWCWTAFMLFIGMRYLDRDSRALRYGQMAILPFFVMHQQVILAVAYFAVQWGAGILPKLLIAILASFTISLGSYELLVRRVPPLRAIFSMKTPFRLPSAQSQDSAPDKPSESHASTSIH